MKYNQYKFKFYINASHAIYIDGLLGQIHPHTWEVSINILKEINGFVPFNIVEDIIENQLDKYQDKYINDVEPFVSINPTLENICVQFKLMIEKALLNTDWILLKIEISETPSRTYIIDLLDETSEAETSVNTHKYSRYVEEAAIKKVTDIIEKSKFYGRS